MNIPGFFKQETGQGFLVVGGALWLFWKEGASEQTLLLVTVLGCVYVAGEKVRSIFSKEK